MALIEWREQYRTGFDGVDFEHEQLIGQINQVFALIDIQSDPEMIINALGDVYGNISAHFALEEKMMLIHGYSHYPAHQADHEHLLDDIRDISDEFEQTSVINKDKFKQILSDWFLAHFQTHDSRLHKLAHMREHDHVCGSTMKRMIRNAKRVFLRQSN